MESGCATATAMRTVLAQSETIHAMGGTTVVSMENITHVKMLVVTAVAL